MLADETNEEEVTQEQSEEVEETPFQPAVSNPDDAAVDPNAVIPMIDDTHPLTDSGVDEQELYDEGVSGAVEAEEPNSGNTVESYHEPDKPDNPS